MNRSVYLYWIGPKYTLLMVLEKLIQLHSNNGQNYKVILITPENIREYITIPDCFYKLSASDQADYVRINVICEYGGIWLDMDTIVMNNLDSLFKIMDTKEGFLMLENNTILVAGVFGSRPHTKFMEEWKKRANNIVVGKAGNVTWGEISSKAMMAIWKEDPACVKEYVLLRGLDTIYPVNYPKCNQEYLLKPYDNYKHLIREFQPIIVLVRSVYIELKNKTINEILDMHAPINYFIDKSIENLGMTKNTLHLLINADISKLENKCESLP